MELCGIRVDRSHGSLHELCTSLSLANKIRSQNDNASQYHLNLFENHEEWYDMVMAISSCPFENVGTSLQALAVEWLNEVGETTAAAWFEQDWTGPRNGRWLMAHASYGNVTNNNCLESWWRWMKEYTCQKKRVAMCMFLANLFKHLRAESVEHDANSPVCMGRSPVCMGSSN